VNRHQVLDLLRRYESRNVTFVEPDGSWPIVWDRAKGVHVRDADGNKYLDLTAAFGVAAAGHANPHVIQDGQRQMARLLHAMGDVHPHELKARLARELSRITFERWGKSMNRSTIQRAKTIFCNSGFEAVEAALKTATLATGKPDVIVFEGAYHGLGYGALNATHREHFRGPFRSQLREFGHFLPFPVAGMERGSPDPQHPVPPRRLRTPVNPGQAAAIQVLEDRIRRLFRHKKIGAILVEPVQVRGGINIPPLELLPMLRRVCDEHQALLILDEIYTGFGRTGKWFACEHSNIAPDILCLGKALTGGFPLSACVGRARLMDDAWPASRGEAIHTSTFLGHPVGCAMALAQLEEIRRLNLVERSAELGRLLLKLLQSKISSLKSHIAARGLGLLAGLELRLPDGSPATAETMRVIKSMLHRGFILLPEGEHANVISFTPPLTITEAQLESAVRALQEVIVTDNRR
jgi:4-aminobutyrate aminotransferase-like enzyme